MREKSEWCIDEEVKGTNILYIKRKMYFDRLPIEPKGYRYYTTERKLIDKSEIPKYIKEN
tara:strand:+ start:438 stop:617 length:180 start_codon:yes stop_codon:yes gene_type:complete